MPEAQPQSALFPDSVASSLSSTTTTYRCVRVLPELAEKAATLSRVDQATYYFAISTNAAVAWYGYLKISFTWNAAVHPTSMIATELVTVRMALPEVHRL
jgi:hypothetical protein